MSYSVAPLLLASALLLLAAGWDIARRRIPNWVNAALAATGILAQSLYQGGWSLLGGLGAALIVLVLLWTPWSGGRLGGGDLKVTFAAAIWIGVGELPRYLLAAGLILGLLAVVSYALSSRAARQHIRGNLKLAALRSMPEAPLRSVAGRISVPFGAAAAAGALLILWWR
jgi:Flp pilus assembly protein protease CpaA